MYKHLSEVKQPLPDEIYRPDIILQDATEEEIFTAIGYTKKEITEYLDNIKDFPDYLILCRADGNIVISLLSGITSIQVANFNNIMKGKSVSIKPFE